MRKLSARPRHHAQDAAALATLKKIAASLDAIAARDAAGKPIEGWFQDQARIGQKHKITRRWARRGTRPSAPLDQRTRSAWSSAPSARPRAAPPAWSCRAATPPRWRCRDGAAATALYRFRSYDDILDGCCHAWNKLVDQPWTIMSIGLRDGPHRF